MTLEINIDNKYERIIKSEPFEFEILETTDQQMHEMEVLGIKIEQLVKDKFCFNHPKSRVSVRLSWEARGSHPRTSVFTCCPTFAERLQQTLLKNGVIANGVFLKVLQSSSQN